MAVAQLHDISYSSQSLPTPLPVARPWRRPLAADYFFFSGTLFVVAMIYIGCKAAGHASVDRANQLRRAVSGTRAQISSVDRRLARARAATTLEPWALAAGFEFEPSSVIVPRLAKRVVRPGSTTSPPPQRSRPRFADPVYAQAR